MIISPKKILAIILCLAMCISMFMPALAASQNSVQITLSESSLQQSDVDQTVTLSIGAVDGVAIDSLQYTVSAASPLTVGTLTMPAEITGYSWVNNEIAWYWMGAAGTNLENVTNLGEVVITIPANTPAGNYAVSVTKFNASADAEFWVEQASYSTTLTVAAAEPVAPGNFAATISAAPSTVTVGDPVTATVAVTGDAFASAQISVAYDSAKLTYTGISGLGEGGQVDSSQAGVLTIVDTGETKAANSYKISFTSKLDGIASIQLTDAAFSTKADAAAKDLTDATVTVSAANVTIEKEMHAVTLPNEWFSGNSEVEDGGDYTFVARKWDNYVYGTVTYTIDGGSAQQVSPNADGEYTIENVTGVLVISMAADPAPKQYSVTIVGDTAANDGNTATYNTDYHFTLPEDREAGLEAGYTYELTAVTIGGNAYDGCIANDKVHTIPGADIIGDIVITITKNELAANRFTVKVTGTGIGDAEVVKSPVDKNEAASITLTKDDAYQYEVSATMGGNEAEIEISEDTYTVKNVTANVVFTVTKTLNVESAIAKRYVTVDGSEMWLIKIGTEKADGKVYTYGGEQMFWSDAYGAYCYIVIADASPAITAQQFGLITGAAEDVVYDSKDVNKTGRTDANDAQFVYNLYRAEYDAVSGDVTVEKFLRADVTGDEEVNMEDAAAIVSYLLEK